MVGRSMEVDDEASYNSALSRCLGMIVNCPDQSSGFPVSKSGSLRMVNDGRR